MRRAFPNPEGGWEKQTVLTQERFIVQVSNRPSVDVQHHSPQSQCRKDFSWLKRFEQAWPVIAVARTTMAEIAKIRKTEEKKKAAVAINQYKVGSPTYA